jgi:arylsulfatase A-like enzyme
VHIILYVLDALRPDHLGCYGYERDTSPWIDGLAREGAVFDSCFTSSTWTRPVAASILTGAYPALHQTRFRTHAFSTRLATLPDLLRDGGFHSAAFSTMGNVAGSMGFDRGFDEYHDIFLDPDILSRRRRLNAVEEGVSEFVQAEIALPRAEDINDKLYSWLAENRALNTLSFIWSLETHDPYCAPKPFRVFSRPAGGRLLPSAGDRSDLRSAGAADRQRLIDWYDEEVTYSDHCIGQIVRHLRSESLYDDTLFIVTADHGEAFYEHGSYGHGHAPYDEVIRVPLIIRFPDGAYAGQRDPSLVELIDLLPTLLDVVGAPAGTASSQFIQGRSVIPLLERRTAQARELAFSDTQRSAYGNRYLSARSSRWKYIRVVKPQQRGRALFETFCDAVRRGLVGSVLRSPGHFLRASFHRSGEYLFDLQSDPGEQQNLAQCLPGKTSEYRVALEEWLARNESLAAHVDALPYHCGESEMVQQHLRRLGYL